ncbi:hypothetical protein GZH53_14700 [Flavihumibacter sp. R14]|nr:hypothetical protein [Flavihumibacter soli]
MKKLLFIFFSLNYASILHAQNSPDTLKKEQAKTNADDPSQFITRVEIYNELQHHDNNGNDLYLNQTVFRTVLKIGKLFTTRLDLPFIYNSMNTPANYKQSGIGDISFRLLGYKFLETGKSAFTASIEISLNTAQSPLLGTGKNLVIPVISYSRIIPEGKFLLACVLQQVNSVSGEETRGDISFSKLQVIGIKALSKRSWVVVAPEWYLDYVHGGLSMNLRSRLAYAPTGRVNIWITPSAGIFGDFIGRYQWSADIGGRYFLFREMNFKKKKGG